MNDNNTRSLSTREMLIGLALSSPLVLVLLLIVEMIVG
jgi:hypothetical protein